MTETKRRGRPPGSRNKPKAVEPAPLFEDAPALPADPSWADTLTEAARKPTFETTEADAGYADLAPLLERPSTIKVALVIRQALSTPGEELIVDWPIEWRLPQQGERVVLRKDWGGMVQSIDYDLGRGIPIIHLR